MVEELRAKKQTYLRSAIMDAGYDVEQFVSLLSVKRGFFS